MSHPTTEPEDVDDSVRAERLASDLRDLEADTGAVVVREYETTGSTAVKFDVPAARRVPSSIMRVLGKHDADLTGVCLESGGGNRARAYV